MSEIRVVTSEPPDTQDVPNVSKLPTSDDFGVGALVKVNGVLYRRCAAPLGEKRKRFGKPVPEDTKPPDRAPGEWTQVTSGFQIEGHGAVFEALRPPDREGPMVWPGYASLERARRDAVILANKHGCSYTEDV